MAIVTIALYNNSDPWDIGARAIKWWHSSEWSHCELLIDGVCYSSSISDGGVRDASAQSILRNPEHWTLKPVTWGDAARVLDFFHSTDGEPYGWSDVIKRQFLNIRGNDKGWFCSEWCAAALGIPNAGMYGPQALADLVMWVNNLTA